MLRDLVRGRPELRANRDVLLGVGPKAWLEGACDGTTAKKDGG